MSSPGIAEFMLSQSRRSLIADTSIPQSVHLRLLVGLWAFHIVHFLFPSRYLFYPIPCLQLRQLRVLIASSRTVQMLHTDAASKVQTSADMQSCRKRVSVRHDLDLSPQYEIRAWACLRQFADEKWLDLRRLDLIAPIMLERLDIMKAKGCDAVEWDNADLPVHEVNHSLHST